MFGSLGTTFGRLAAGTLANGARQSCRRVATAAFVHAAPANAPLTLELAAAARQLQLIGRHIGRLSAQPVAAAARAASRTSGRVAAFAKERPTAFACVLGTAKATLADVCVQHWLEGVDWQQVDARRTLGFAAFGLVYLGGVQSLVYYRLYPALFPKAVAFAGQSLRRKLADTAGLAAVLRQTAFEILVYSPVVYFPSYYVLTGAIKGEHPLQCLAACRANIEEDMADMALFWGPLQGLNFVLLPMHMRIPTMCLVGVVWLGYLSSSKNGAASPTCSGGE